MKLLSIVSILVFAFSAQAQKILTNQDVIDLTKLGIKEDLIITSINLSATNFDTSADNLIGLKKSGVSNDVVAAIVKKAAAEDAPEARERVSQITQDAGRFFKQGLSNILDNRRKESGEDFNNSIEIFLKAPVNVNTNAKLLVCYSQLIETVYRMEFPSAQQPQIKNLSVICGWNLDAKLADGVVAKLNALTETAQGFKGQKFEPSPLDELAKLELTPEEKKTVLLPQVAAAILGSKPAQAADGKVPLVMKYFNDYFNDPYSMRIIKWSNLVKVYLSDEPYWGVQVRFRAKNGFGAYVLSEMIFYIQHNKVVKTKTLF